jgi:hypothetical protein
VIPADGTWPLLFFRFCNVREALEFQGSFLVVGLTSFDTTFILTSPFVSRVKILRTLLLEARPGLGRDGHGLRGGF